jgi:amidase
MLDATAQASLVRRREVTPAELLAAAIARIERLNPRLNAVITPLFDQARAQVTAPPVSPGPFHGVPLLLKDYLCEVADTPYHEGMRFLRDIGWRSRHDTYLAAKLRAAGYEPVPVELGELKKGGGSVRCCIAELRPAAL